VQVDAPCAAFGEQRDDVVRREGGTYGVAKWIAPAVANCPEAEGKLVFRPGIVFVVRHDSSEKFAA
jgi:hypothetical protein